MAGTQARNKYHAESSLPTGRSFVGGDYLSSASGSTFVSRHPGNDRVICEVEEAGEKEVNAAIQAAADAFVSWSRTPAAERGEILRRAASILRARNQELAELETLDTGKPISETSVVDIVTGAEVIEYFAGVAQSIHGQHIDLPPEAFAMVRREPLGVCAGITRRYWVTSQLPAKVLLITSVVAMRFGKVRSPTVIT